MYLRKPFDGAFPDANVCVVGTALWKKWRLKYYPKGYVVLRAPRYVAGEREGVRNMRPIIERGVALFSFEYFVTGGAHQAGNYLPG